MRTSHTYEMMFYENKVKNFKGERCKTTVADNGDVIYEVDRKVYYLYGSTACGKTKGIGRKYGNDVSILTQLKAGMNYDDYNNTGVMVLDEFYGQLTLQDMLNLLDNYLTQLPCRYNNRDNVAHTIIMTSNLPFNTLYKDVRLGNYEKYKAFVRRVNGGVWEMYQSPNGDRYIACRTNLEDVEERLRGGYDLSKPPVALSGSADGSFAPVKLVSLDELKQIKYADSSSTSTDDNEELPF